MESLNGAESYLSVNAFRTMDAKVQAHETTEDSGSGSAMSDFEELENGTDTFGQAVLQHARNAQRLQNAVNGNVRAFRKARPRPGVLDQMQANEQANGGIEHQRTGSGGSNDSEPPLNIPREWGRKARRNKHWMRKILVPSDTDVGPESESRIEERPKTQDDAIFPHKTAYTGDNSPIIDWAAAAAGSSDHALPSVENTPPSMSRKERHASTPPSLRRMNSSLQHIMESEDQDFTAASLLASTPAVGHRNSKLDELTRREIETIEKQAVTTRTLDQISERAPNETLRRRSSSRMREAAAIQQQSETRPMTAPETRSRLPRRRSLISNKENIPTSPGKADAVQSYKGAETVSIFDRSVQAKRPTHMRGDSYNLLKRLARVSSSSPSPAKDTRIPSPVKRKLGEKGARERSASPMKTQKGAHFAPSSPAKTREQDWQGSAQSPVVETMNGHETDDRRPEQDTAPQENDVDATPAPKHQDLNPKTPVVTGAWIDTPRPLLDVRPLLQTTDSEIVRAFSTPSGMAALEPPDPIKENLLRIQSEPVHPRSALEALVQDAKDRGEFGFDESTIQSLEDIINPTLDPTDPTFTLDLAKHMQEPVDEEPAADQELATGEPLTQAERERRQEDLALEGLNKHLRAARTNLKDANRGLRRVENRMDVSRMTSPGPVTLEARCDGYHGSVWKALWTEFRSLFYTWDAGSKYRIRFTWLGLATLLWWSWFLSETTLW